MTEIRKRQLESGDFKQEAENATNATELQNNEEKIKEIPIITKEIDSDDDRLMSDDERVPEEKLVEEHVRKISSSPKEPEHKLITFINQLLERLPPRWRNWVIRGIFTFLMLTMFVLLIWIGPIALVLATIGVQVRCFHEVIAIGYAIYKVHGLPWFRTLGWYFLVITNYFFYGEVLFDYFTPLKLLATYHRFISFSLYVGGFVLFVLSLVKRYYIRQFSLFAWTHCTLLLIVTQSYLNILNIFEGMVWYIVPVLMIVCNDVMAYMCGFFFGRTPLIKLSPKKTWEGFIGGGIFTVIFAYMFSIFLCQFPYLVCPVEFADNSLRVTDCEPGPLFRLTRYDIPEFAVPVFTLLGVQTSFNLYPYALHSLPLSIFSSVIGPFGGFFASGFKRAFKIKDFADIIPGHGGIVDRFDCQYLMATFVYVYISTFIRVASPQKLLALVDALKPEQQIEFFNMLKDALLDKGFIPIAGN